MPRIEASDANFVGEGLQFRVWKLSKARVLKTPQSVLRAYNVRRSWRKNNDNPFNCVSAVIVCRHQRNTTTKILSAVSDFPSIDVFGHAVFHSDGSYSQDIIDREWHGVFRSADIAQALDVYMEAQKYLAGFGIAECSFDILGSTGRTPAGDFFVFDFHETCKLEEWRIKKRANMWRRKSSFKYMTDDRGREQIDRFFNEMNND